MPRDSRSQPDDDARSDAKPRSARPAIVAIFLLALLMAGGNLWYQRSMSVQAHGWWGSDATTLIVRAPQVELLELGPLDPSANAAAADVLKGFGWQRRIVARRDATGAPGLVHMRKSLIIDRSYDWQEDPDACQADWRYALRFVDGAKDTILVFSLDCPRAANLGARKLISTQPIGEALRRFFAYFETETPASAPQP